MNFSLTEEQEAVRDLARQILADRVGHERSKELETSGTWFDPELWRELAAANLPGIALPEAVGGSGLGILEVCLVLEEAGRHLAPVPLLPTLVLGGLPIAEFGTAAQHDRWLRPVAGGEGVLSAALHESGSADPARPRTTAASDGEGWRLDGAKVCVPAAQLADCLLVPARTGADAVGVFLVEPGASGVKIERQEATQHEPQGLVTLSGVRVGADAVLGDPRGGRAIVDWTVEHARLGIAAMQLGVAEEAMRRTAAYVAERKQFGRPIGSMQGPQLRIADAFIDVEAMRSVLLLAAWRLSEGRPAAAQVAAAKWWAARACDRVVHTAQHLHGGIGADVDYPIHRFFLWAQQLSVTLGGAQQQLADLGALLVRGDRSIG